MALLLLTGTIIFGSVTIRTSLPVYGLALLLGLLWAVKLATAEVVSWKKSLMHLPVGAFAVYALLRYCSAPVEYDARLELFRVGVCTLLYFVSACNFYQPSQRRVLIGALLLLGIAEAFYGLGQFLTRATTIFGWPRAEGYLSRASGTFFCPNHLAGFLEMALCVVVARLALDRSVRSNLQNLAVEKIYLVFGSFVISLGVVATLSRGGWLSAVVGLTMLLFWGGWKWSWFWPRLVVAGAAVVFLGGLAFKSEIFSNRFIQAYWAANPDKSPVVLSIDDHTTLGPRIKIWKSSVEMIREHPVWGSGGGSWEWVYPKHRADRVAANPQYPHNDYLNLLSDYGLVGFALVAIGLTCFFAHAYSVSRSELSSEERSFAVGSVMAVTAILAHSIFDFNLHIFANAALFMTLMGFTVAINGNPKASTSERVVMRTSSRYALAAGLVVVCGLGGWFITRTALGYHYGALGDVARTMLKYDEAVAWYHRALRMDPKNAEIYVGMGHVFLNQSQWRRLPGRRKEQEALAQQAIEWYQKALKINPYYVDVLLKVARAYEILEDREQFLSCCQRVIDMDPFSPYGYSYLAKFYLRENDLNRAEEAALKARRYGWLHFDRTPDVILDEIKASRNRPQ